MFILCSIALIGVRCDHMDAYSWGGVRHKTNDDVREPVYVMRNENSIYFYIDPNIIKGGQEACRINTADVNTTYKTFVGDMKGDKFSDNICVKKDGSFWTMNVETTLEDNFFIHLIINPLIFSIFIDNHLL